MLAFTNVLHFLAHKLARLSAGRFALTFVFTRSFDCFFFRHNKKVSPPAGSLDVKDLRVTATQPDCEDESAIFAGVAETFDAIVRLFDLCELTRDDVPHRPGETVSQRLLVFFYRRIFTPFAFSQNGMVVSSG